LTLIFVLFVMIILSFATPPDMWTWSNNLQ